MAKALDLATIPVYHSEHLPDKNTDFLSGAILLVDKPQSWTSFDAVKYLRGRVRVKKVGHAGTLDPMATGLLVLCTGKATKSIEQIQDMRKTYVGEITFGGKTPSYDAESEVEQTAPFEHITKEQIEEVLKADFTGDIMQVPPMYSALKRDGKKLYELARRGKSIELEPRPVTIYEINILKVELPKIEVEITCSKGTYIRSIANDLGVALGSLGYLSKLVRTKIGHFSNDQAMTPHAYNDLLNTDG